jgi:heme A synthase
VPSEVDLAGSFGVGIGGVLLVALVLVSLAFRARPGGLSMTDPRRRWRLLTAVACLALAAVVGLVGWLKLSLEPQVNHQLPYLASAGMALVLLAAVGGSLLVADQLRSDDQRIADLEDAVRRLATTLEPLVESPPRRK